MTSWKIEGDYAETCSCTTLCPCIFTNMQAKPTEGNCMAALGMRINKGEKDGVKLDGLSFILVLDAPGPMIEGKLKVGLIVDDKASDAQVEAITAIATGSAGGPMANLAPLVGEVAGIERRKVEFSGDGMNFTVRAGNLIDQEIAGFPTMSDPNVPIYVDNVAHPVNSRLALAKAVRSAFNAFGITWKDSSGTRNGHFAPFKWAA
jgi:hypothetical protein